MQHSAVRLSRHFNPSKALLRKFLLHEARNPQPSYRLLDPPPWKREG